MVIDNNDGDRRHWHLEKSVSITHILSTVVMVLGALSFSFSMDKRIAILEASSNQQTYALTRLLEDQRRTDAKQDVELETVRRQAREDYNALGEKMERLIQINKQAISDQR